MESSAAAGQGGGHPAMMPAAVMEFKALLISEVSALQKKLLTALDESCLSCNLVEQGKLVAEVSPLAAAQDNHALPRPSSSGDLYAADRPLSSEDSFPSVRMALKPMSSKDISSQARPADRSQVAVYTPEP